MSQLNYFIRFYHTHLINDLVLLGYKKTFPTLHQLQFDFHDRQFYGAVTMFSTMALSMSGLPNDTSMVAFYDDTETGRKIRRDIYSNERYIKAMKLLIPFFEKRGIFKSQADCCYFTRRLQTSVHL